MSTPNTGTRPVSAFPARPGAPMRRLQAVEANPIIDAIVRKLTPDIEPGQTQPMRGGGEVLIPDPAYLRQTATQLAQDTTDAASVMQLLPDMQLVKNLLISSILAPKDLMSSEVTFSYDRRAFNLPIGGRLLEVIADHFTNVYNIKELLPVILEEALFFTGSYPVMVIPENSLDALITGRATYANEAFAQSSRTLFDSQGNLRPLGLLGPGPTPSQSEAKATPGLRSALESLSHSLHAEKQVNPAVESLGTEFAPYVSVTDNYNVLKFPSVREAMRSAARRKAIHGESAGMAMESMGEYQLGGPQRRTLSGQTAMVQAVKTKDMLVTPMVGHPMITRLPSEAVIPVFITPKKHLGYFVLLDEEGQALQLANQKDVYHALNTSAGSAATGNGGASQMIQMAQNLSMGIDVNENKQLSFKQMVKIYGQLLEHDLKARLASSGMNDPAAAIKAPEEIYQIMLGRTMKRMRTQLLYVPAELMTYFAFDYADNGTGRSLLEKTKILSSMRVMLGFANVMAGIKNSVSRQRLNLTLSENDPDPSKTVARVIDEFTRRRNTAMPFASDPADMISYINMAGVEFNIEGKGAPAHKVDVEDKVSNRAKVDTELNDMLRDQHYMGLGVTPEAVLASTGADFAATVVTNNQMTAKRVITIQDQFTPQIEDHVRVVATNDAVILNALREVVLASLTDINKEGDAETAHHDVVDQSKPSATPVLEDYTHRPVDPAREAKISVILTDFIQSIKVSLPRPDTGTIAAQNQAFDAMSEAIDKKLSMIVDSSFLTDANLGQYAGHVDELKASIKAAFMRQWMRSNGFLPEMEELMSLDEDGKPEFDLMKIVTEHNHVLELSLSAYLTKIAEQKTAIKAVADDLSKKFPDANMDAAAGGGDAGFGGGDGGFGGDAGGTGGAGGGEFGMDDNGAGLDAGGFGNDAGGELGGTADGSLPESDTTLDETGLTGASAAGTETPDDELNPDGTKKKKDGEEDEDETAGTPPPAP